MSERDRLISIPENSSQEQVQKSAASPVSKESLTIFDPPVFRITSDEPEEADEYGHGEGKKFIVIREKERRRIFGSGRFITFAVIWVVLVVCIIALGIYFRLEYVESPPGIVTPKPKWIIDF